MNEQDTHLELIRRYLDGAATAEETQTLEALILRDPAMRREFLSYAHLDSALAGNLRPTLIEGGLRSARQKAQASAKPRSHWLQWRPLAAAAAAGIVLGIFCASVVFAHGSFGSLPKERRLFPLTDGNFEQGTGKLPVNPPSSFGTWTGDGAETVEASSEARPKSGRKMLRFVRAETDPPTGSGVPSRCDVYQLIDLGPIWEQVGKDDEVTLELRASFLDADAGPKGSGAFRCRLLVNPGEPETIRNGWPESRFGGCAYARTDLENEPATLGQWRTAQAKVLLPRNARVAAVHLEVIRFTDAPNLNAEFGHCYVDDVSLAVVARPLAPRQ